MDPASPVGKHHNESLRTLDQLQDRPCLVLLGEPGIGKSYALEGARKALLSDDSSLHILLDLKGRSEASLVRFVDRDPYSTWLRSQGHLTLWVDSLDESVDRLLPNALLELLESAPRERLSLRIVCRTAVWPTTLEERLKRLWSDLETWELVPVSRADVEAAAKTRGIDAPSFMAQIEDRDVGALASRPITLELLFKLFDGGSSLPDSRLEVYRKGLEKLCEEHDEDRPRAGGKDTLPLHARKVIAGRIAVLTLLCGRDTIWTGRAREQCPEGAIDLEALSGGTERSNGDEISITHDRVQEVLNSSLFSERGHQGLGWAHRTFMEVLAAEYLVATRLPALMLLGKLIHPEDDEQEVAPQFYGLAAWLTEVGAGDEEAVAQTRASDFFELLLQRQPELLLGCDLQRYPEHRREKVVERLLQRYGDNKIDRGFMQGRLQWQRLRHSGLAEQLRPYLVDRDRAWEARCAALYIARACKLASLQEEYLSLALDPQEQMGLRIPALYALEEVGSSEVRARLRPLLSLPLELDKDDELHGGALSCMWPGILSPDELFQHLHKRRNFSYLGSYCGFLEDTLFQPLPSHIDPVAFFPPALRWIQRLPAFESSDLAGEELVEVGKKLAAGAWEQLEHPSVFQAFADLQVEWMTTHYCLIGVPPHPEVATPQEVDRRRRLTSELLQHQEYQLNRFSMLALLIRVLLTANDLDWLIERFREAADDASRSLICDVVNRLLPDDYLPYVDWLQSLLSVHPLLNSYFGHRIQVELGSTLANHLRGQYEAEVAAYGRVMPQKRSEALPTMRSPTDVVLSSLAACEIEPGHFCALDRALALSPKGDTVLIDCRYLDIRETPGWMSCDPETRTRIALTAQRFLSHVAPEESDWNQPGGFSVSRASGLRALYLLKVERPTQYDSLPLEIWERWAPALVRVSINTQVWWSHSASAPDYPGLDIPLLADAYARIPDHIQGLFLQLLGDPSFESQHPLLLAKLNGIWDEPISDLALELVKGDSLALKTWRMLVRDLMHKQRPGVLEWALSCLSKPLPDDELARQRMEGLALCVLVHAPRQGWPLLWPQIEAHTAFGCRLRDEWLVAVDQTGSKSLFQLEYSAQEALLRLLLWHYPRQETKAKDAVFTTATSATRSAERVRDALLSYLKKSATREAVDVLKRLEQSSPQPEYLHHHIREGLHIMRERGFPSQEPRALLEWLKGGALQQLSERLLGAITLPEPVPVFVSYAHEDLALIKAIKPLLEQMRVAPFVDLIVQKGGELWEAELRRHIDQAQHVFVFWSRWSSTSPEVEKEWRYALVRMERDGLADRFIIPIILDGKKPNKDHPLARFHYLFFQAGQLEWGRPGM